MKKILFKILFILILGILGGMIFQVFILPFLMGIPYFQNFNFIKILTEKRMIVNPPPGTVIFQENDILQKSIEKVEKVVAGVSSQPKKGKILEGSGLILTNDGSFVTLASLVPQGADINLFWEGEKISYQILKKDFKADLALIKFGKNNLNTASFADLGKIKLGQRVFLVGIIFSNGVPQKIVDEGIIQTIGGDSIGTNIFENNKISGSPIFSIEGEVIGLGVVDDEGKVSVIPINKIREFAGL